MSAWRAAGEMGGDGFLVIVICIYLDFIVMLNLRCQGRLDGWKRRLKAIKARRFACSSASNANYSMS